jgi:hypothetical protein
VEDDHVDRPGVEVRQRMKLTGTNSSIGLIIHIARTHPEKLDGSSSAHAWAALRADAPRGAKRPAARSRVLGLRPGAHLRTSHAVHSFECWVGKVRIGDPFTIHHSPFTAQLLIIHAFCRPGGSGGVAAPVPIPNTAVKRPSADGTSSQDAGE